MFKDKFCTNTYAKPLATVCTVQNVLHKICTILSSALQLDSEFKLTMKLLFLTLSAIMLPASIMASDADCQLCVDLVTAVESWVANGDNMDSIIEQGVAWCTANVPGMMNSVCDRIIEQYLPDIVDGLMDGVLDPCGICHSIGLCELDTCVPTTVPPTEQPSTSSSTHITSLCFSNLI